MYVKKTASTCVSAVILGAGLYIHENCDSSRHVCTLIINNHYLDVPVL